jgi:hypothetical protein
MAQATTTVNPSSDFIEMSRRIPFMPNEQVSALTASKQFGALALAEISKRNRMALMKQAQDQAMAAGGSGNTVADKEIAALAQEQFREQLANDERMGLNNIVAQAEQGGLEFGEPVEMAGGGMIAFDKGGEVPGFAAGAFIPLAARALSMYGPRILPKLGLEAGKRGAAAMRAHPYITGGVGVASGIPFGLDALSDDEIEGITGFGAASDEVYQGAAGPKVDRDVTGRGRGAAGQGAGGRGGAGIRGLDLEADPRKIRELREQLEKEAGLGEFGAAAKEIRGKRKERVEKTIERALASEPYLAGAEAAGAVRPTGRRGLAGLLDVAAPTIAAMGKSAAGIQRQRTEALDKLAEGEERLALAEEQYRRGNIKDYITESRQAKKDMFTSNLQLEQLKALENYRQQQLGLLQARVQAAAQGRGGMRGTDFTAFEDIRNAKTQELQGLMKDPKKNKDRIAKLEQEILGYNTMIRAGMLRNLSSGISISDEPD